MSHGLASPAADLAAFIAALPSWPANVFTSTYRDGSLDQAAQALRCCDVQGALRALDMAIEQATERHPDGCSTEVYDLILAKAQALREIVRVEGQEITLSLEWLEGFLEQFADVEFREQA